MVDKASLLKTLQKIGFNEKEAQVYLTLLELNEALPSGISRHSGIKRPTTYLILEQLERRGLVSHIKRAGHLYYQACKPDLLIEAEKQKYAELKSTLSDLERALPALSRLHTDLTITPQMSVFKGKDGLIQIMEDTLTVKDKMLLCWANPTVVFSLLEDYYPSYIRKKVKRKIFLKGIFCNDEIAKKLKLNGKRELRDILLISKNKYPLKNEINIYDNKVAIISHEDQTGVIIENENIAETQRVIFNLCFNLIGKPGNKLFI